MKNTGENCEKVDEIDLTVGQGSLWLANQMKLTEGAYNEPIMIHLKGNINIDFLKQSFIKVIQSHSALRTVFIKKDSKPKQFIQQNIEFDIPVYDLTEFQDEEKKLVLKKHLEEPLYKNFNLENAPLFRVQLVKLNSNEYIFHMIFHHIIFDGWSLGILIRQLSDNYSKLISNQKIINQEASYKELVQYEINQIYGASYNEACSYWKKALDRELPYTEFPSDFNRNGHDERKHSGDCISKIIDKNVFIKIKDFAKKNKVSMYRVMLSAYFSLLHQMTNSQDMVVGMPINTRPRSQEADTFGYFINTLPIIVSISKEDTFQKLLNKVNNRVKEATEHQNYPFEHLVQNLKLSGSGNSNFTYSTAFNMVKLPEILLPGIDAKVLTDNKRVSIFDMVWRIISDTTNDEYKIEIDYNSSLYRPETINDLIERFEHLLQKLILHANEPIYSLDLLLDKDHSLYKNINSKIQKYPDYKTLDQLIDIQAIESPDKVAISMGDKQITYNELKQRSNQIASYLCQNKFKKGQRVGIMMERDIDTIVSIIGVLKSGGVYVPIDPNFPESRIHYILKDSNSRIVITRKKYKELIEDNNIHTINIDEFVYCNFKGYIEQQHTSEDIAYIIYTSGSTGLPKGVAVPHKNVINLSYSLKSSFSLTKNDVFLQFASMIFDASIIEIFPVLLFGGKIHIISEIEKRSAEDFINVIKTNHINYCVLPTVFFKLLVSMPQRLLDKLSSLKCIFVGGETLPTEAVRKWQKKMGLDIPIINAYGPTEATVCTTIYEIKQEILDEQSSIPIGKPIHNSEVFVVSPFGTLCPQNVIGELYIGGEGVAKEYINQEEKTRTAFLSGSTLNNPNKRLYRSGDLVRLLPNGNLGFWGRNDNQVKLRGYRIELDEIEEVLLKHPKIKDTVAIVYENDKIVCFYLSQGNVAIKEDALKEFLNTKLPDFMIPSYLFHLEIFPLSPSGKIDKKELKAEIPSLLEKTVHQYIPPTSHTEKVLVGIWSNILNIEKEIISKEDDFFRLGGHSLIAVQVLNQIQKNFYLKLEVKDIFKYRTVSSLSAYIDKLSNTKNNNTYHEKIAKVKEQQHYNLSNAQKRLWFLNKINPIGRVYDVPVQIYIKPRLQKDLLQTSFEFLVKRHEMLRTTFIEKDGEPQQTILKSMPIDFYYEDITHIAKEEQQVYVNRKIQSNDHTPFDLEQGPLFRVQLFNTNRENSYLYINSHHIITDEWSLKYLLDELMRVYHALDKGNTPELSIISNRYIDYVNWQQNQLDTGKWDKEKEYWISELKTPLPKLSLPIDFNHTNQQGNSGDVFRIKLDNEIHKSLRVVCEQENVSMYMLFFAAYIQLLHYLTDQKDIIVGTPIAGRNHEAFEHIQGFFVNTLAIRTQLHDAKNLQQLLQVVKENCLNAFQNQSYPFDKVIEAINPDRGISNNPIFSTMFSYQQDMLQSDGEYSLQLLPFNQTISKFDLSVSVEEGIDSIEVAFEYKIDLFKKESIVRFTQNFSNILQGFINQRTVPYEKLVFLSEKEEALFSKVNNTEKPYPYFKSIQEQFYKQISLYPNQIALSTNVYSLTYEQLNNRSNQVAQHLLENGIKKGDKVALFLDRSIDSIITMIGVLKAGGAYIPIDVKYPKERIEYIVQDSEACRVITKHEYKKYLNLDADKISIVEDIQQTNVNHDIKVLTEPDDLAYVIYTSGSTGKPKGTLLTHKGVLNLALWRKEVFHVSHLDKVTQFYSHSFDSSVSEIFSTLLNGAQLHLLNDEQRYSTAAYTKAIQEIQATISDVPTVFFNELSISLNQTESEKIKSLKFIIMGGEAASASAIRSWQETLQDQVQVVNEYGPTESTVTAMYYPIQACMRDSSKTVPIGMPISNTKVHILNSHMQPCPIGVVGELYIDSIGLAKGYWNQESKTKQAFISNPFSFDRNKRLYRTGDLARWLKDGNIEFMGRRDKQVKIRGHRIELGEIEDALLQFPEITQAVVIPTKDGMLLRAYYKTLDNEQIKNQHLISYLSGVLPEYMLPKDYIHLLEIPVTPNGKVDSSKLLEIEVDNSNINESIILPETTVQKNIAKVWSEALSIEEISIKDDFFNLGGHSLKIMPVLVKLKPLYPNLKIQDFFKYRTIEKLAHHIEDMSNLQIKEDTTSNDLRVKNDIADIQTYNKTELHESFKDVVEYPKTILLTGATGYLGAHILERLLKLPSTLIYCLARKNENQEIHKKLEERMEFYFGTEILSKMKGRIKFLEGDLSLINLGLTSQIINQLKGDLDSIIHCGGDVRHYGEREHFQKVNVQSTTYLLHLAKKADARFHYVSTLSVVGHTENDPNNFIFFESDFDRGQILDNVYLESKFQAEKMVREAIKEGIDGTIYRVGNLVGHSITGKFQYNINENAFYRLLKGIFLSRTAPKVHTYIDLTPIDYCSMAITELSYRTNTIGRTMHICNPVQLNWDQFITNLKYFGYDILLVDEQEYIDKFFNNNLTPQNQQALELIMPLLESVEEGSMSIPSCEYTQRFLNSINIYCLKPNQEYINLLLKYAIEIGFLPPIKEPIML
ncbi:non-ribosomal peptide synthetase [Bacillus pseudomycoides]|uniref:non-ribosomal peptide synthetase n=1 Tax=Bacillus pseudomycoides TaxID=64104 RepID=UPI000BFD2220|nr:non-ribosomal peptide synthetase [Bacillus pseudomycoides]PGR94288.1 non-ribosomal peptide synthetase [Bacillus pseudomycoides]